MGDPKRIRKKYDTPTHPWIKSRIDEEKRIAKEFGTTNKKEIWKMETLLKKFKSQAKNLIALQTTQAEVEKNHLFRRVQELGLVQGEASIDLILGLTIDDIMGRRLQTVVFKKGLARSVKQARQFIVHEHILVGGKKITSPAYIVSVREEASVEFAVSSALYAEDHPERATPEEPQAPKKEAAPVEAEEAPVGAEVTEAELKAVEGEK